MNETNTEQKSLRPVYLVDGARTPFIKARGKPGPFSASDLAVAAARELLLRTPTIRATDFDEVIVGAVLAAPEEANIGRVISIRLGCGKKIPAWTVQRNCASGMQAIDSAALLIGAGRADLILAGGSEAMSRAPLLYNRKMVTWFAGMAGAKTLAQKLAQLIKWRPAMFPPVIALLKGLTDHTVGLNMGQTAEIVAERFNISREEMDGYAVESQRRIAAAQEAERLPEVTPIYDEKGNFFAADDGVRKDTTVASLGKLKPVFDRPFGHITAGNASQITDGAAMLILASQEAVERYHLKPICKIVETVWAGVDPAQMGLGPANAMATLLHRQGLASADIDYWEINEAFAAQVLGAVAAFGSEEYIKEEVGLDTRFDPIPRERLNIDGGAISLGHPVGASGARITLRLAKILEEKKAKRGVASLCIGGGQGGALLLERVEG